MHNKEYQTIITEFTKNWDLERIAFIDMIIMEMAVAELIAFPSIPTKVSMNEYIEIAKFYSTENSNTFINGVLDRVFDKLLKDKVVVKNARGSINGKS